MTMSFDEWFDNQDIEDWTNKKYMFRAYKAGAQSRQAELDKLKQALKTSLAAHECVCLERDELQDRIGEALNKIDFWVNGANGDAAYVAKSIGHILKGNKNEN